MPAPMELSGPFERRRKAGSHYTRVLKSHGVKAGDPDQKSLEKAYKRVGTPREKKYDDLVGKDEKGRYFLD